MLEIENFGIEGIYKEDNSSPWIKIKITDRLKSKIKEFTQQLVKRNYPYDALCWALAEFELIFEKGHKMYSEQEVIERQKSLFDSCLDYEDICWFIANLKIYLEEAKLFP